MSALSLRPDGAASTSGAREADRNHPSSARVCSRAAPGGSPARPDSLNECDGSSLAFPASHPRLYLDDIFVPKIRRVKSAVKFGPVAMPKIGTAALKPSGARPM